MTNEIITSDKAIFLNPAGYASGKNPAMVYITSLSERSRRVQKQSLKSILAMLFNLPIEKVVDDAIYNFQWHKLRYEHTIAIRTRLAETYTFRSANRILSALRRVLKECWRLGYMDNETMARACDIQNISGETVPAGRNVKRGEIDALADACYSDENAVLGVRDMSILGVLYTTGIRRNELAGLDLSDYKPDENKLLIRKGKRNTERTVYLPDSACEALDDWITYRGDEAGGLFLPINKGGNIVRKYQTIAGEKHVKGITSQTVYDMLSKRAKQANVDDFSPHDLRRTFVGDMLDKGVDIVTVQKIAGHANVTTTARYDRRGERAKAEAVNKLHFPYRKRKTTDS